MTGRPGYRREEVLFHTSLAHLGHQAMEMNGGSSVSYLARTSCVPSFCTLLGLETEGLLDYQGRAGIISIVRWNLRPVIFGVEFSLQKKPVNELLKSESEPWS